MRRERERLNKEDGGKREKSEGGRLEIRDKGGRREERYLRGRYRGGERGGRWSLEFKEMAKREVRDQREERWTGERVRSEEARVRVEIE